MHPFHDRYARQRQLKEVGPKGQLRLESTVLRRQIVEGSAPLHSLACRDWLELYLSRAGLSFCDDPEGTDPNLESVISGSEPTSFTFEFASSRALFEGCNQALSTLFHLLEAPQSPL